MSAPPTDKILLVDDDPHLVAALTRSLRHLFHFDTALSGAEALKLIDRHGPYAVIVADISMPLMSGIELLETVHETSPETVGIVLTGNCDQRSAVEAVNRAHVFQFLCKPCDPETLIAAITAGLKQSDAHRIEHLVLHGTTGGGSVVLVVPGVLNPAVATAGKPSVAEERWKQKTLRRSSTTSWRV